MKITKKWQKIIDDIKYLTNIDISKICEQTKRRFLSVETDSLNKNQVNQIILIGIQYLGYRVESNGHERIALLFK